MSPMAALKPEHHHIVEWYKTHLDELMRIADECNIPRFSRVLCGDLGKLVKNHQAVQVLEAATRIGNFGNFSDHAAIRKAVSRQLKREGFKAPRGKRTAPGLLEFVETISPIFLYFGLPLGTGEGSRLVEGLRMIAGEIDVKGDPRDELRRLVRAAGVRKATILQAKPETIRKSVPRGRLRDVWAQVPDKTRKAIREAVARSLESMKVHNPR